MTMISPSILSANFADLKNDCEQVLSAGAQMLHFDVMDGHFVPNISFGAPVLASLHKALPEVFYDVHLMIDHPLKYLPDFAKAGATLYNFHVECKDDVAKTLAEVKKLNLQAGLTIKPATPVSALEPYLKELDLVLVMSVEPGFGGQSFMPSALDKISELKRLKQEHGYTYNIQVDGGIDVVTAPLCVKAGVDILVAGSAIFGATDREKAVKALMI